MSEEPGRMSTLNPEQREAAEHFEGPLLVLAGAGSGKTRVLTVRIANLIEEFGVDPASILALTFTNKAAGEMRERVRTLLDRDPAGMWIGTFHAIGARMLRRDATRIGWSPTFLIYDADDSQRVIKRIIKDDLRLDLKRWSPKVVRGAISAAKNELVGVQEYAEQALDPFTRTVAQVYERYARTLREANAFDFDDLLVRPVEILQAFPDVLNRYRDRFRFVLVDEYQDTNRAQYTFLRLMAGDAANLFVVGDDDQSIYGWRGADLRNILDFEKDFPNASMVRLEENYRSTRTILEAANQVISRNVNRKGKTLRTGNADGESLTLVEMADEADEATWIVSEIQARLSDDPELEPRHFVILYRTNAQSRALEEALRREALPYRIVGGQRFYERREVKDVLAYLRLVANPDDDQAFLRIVNVPRRGIGDTSVAHLAEWAGREGVSLLKGASRADEVSAIRGAATGKLIELAGLLDEHRSLADQGIGLEEILRSLVSGTGFLESLREEGPEGDERIDNVDELIAGAADLQARLDEGDPDLLAEIEESGAELRTIDIFLAHVALIADIDQHDPTANAVSLMTLHNAKGLEFPVVFLAGLEEGLFPLSRVFDEPDQMEEERRLFYVGITRAERKVYLTTARRRRRGREWLDSVPSSFLEALPGELMDVRKSARLLERTSSYRPWRRQAATLPPRRRERLGMEAPLAPARDAEYVDYADTQDPVRLVKGARVRHPQFGAGTVKELSGGGVDVRATIDFDDGERKKVVVRYANLQPEWE
ncbi:MAG TPA: UvrD-helicase domain-containing protein [Longimicrobiaceae bacterium]|nr:UvrD-helicase domain-containing protein [Longimicrobiaceae bacterium]